MSEKAYFDLSIPAPRRLAMMRADLARHQTRYPRCPDSAKPRTWKDIRSYKHGSWQAAFCTLSPGKNGNRGVWYSHDGPEFRNERDAHDVVSLRHSGWFTDTDQRETAIGIVASLTRGRFIAGYRWTSNGERVYFPDVFDDESDAARMADEHARVFADEAREDSERFDAMQDAEIAAGDALEALRDTWDLRRTGRRDSDDVREAIEALREARETLREATAAYKKG